jgi:hypothetical protein
VSSYAGRLGFTVASGAPPGRTRTGAKELADSGIGRPVTGQLSSV